MPFSLQFLLFLIQPFWSSIYFLFSCAQKRPNKSQIILLIFSISLLGIYWYPWGDAQVHFGIYYCDTVEIYANTLISKFASLYDITIREIANICGNYMWGYLFWIFIPWSIYSIAIWDRIEQDNIKPYTLIIWLLILIIGIRELLDLNRNISSFLLYVSALMLFNRYRLFSAIILICALILHTSCIVLFITATFCSIFLLKIRLKPLLILLIIAISIGGCIAPIISIFTPQEFINTYIDGSFGAGRGVDSGFFYLMTVINIVMSFFIGYLTFKSYDKINKNFLFASYLASCFLSLLFWFLWTMRERFIIANFLLGFSVLICNWKFLTTERKHFRKLLYALISLSIIKIILVLGVEYSSEIIHHTGSLKPKDTIITVLAPTYLPTYCLIDIEEYGFNDRRLQADFPIAKQFISTQ